MSRPLRFDGRVAIVTGAGAGLGAAYAVWLAERGARVVVNNRRRGVAPSSAGAVVAAIRACGGEAIADEHAVENESSGLAMVQSALDHYDRIDIVVANAGVGEARPIDETDSGFLRRSVDINYLGSLYPVLAALPHMRAQDYGRVVLTTSTAGLFGAANQAAYAGSKMALVGFARALGFELRKTNITVNTISPYARTKMSSHILDARLAELMAPERVAPVVGWLCSEMCQRSGLILSAGGGRVRRTAIVESPVAAIRDDGSFDHAIIDDLSAATETRHSAASAAELIPELRAAA